MVNWQQSYMPEYAEKTRRSELSFDETENSQSLDPTYVQSVFKLIVEEQLTRPNTKQRPTRYERVVEVFKGREAEAIPVQELYEAFAHNRNPQNVLGGLMARLNRDLAKYDLRIEPSTTTVYRVVPINESEE